MNGYSKAMNSLTDAHFQKFVEELVRQVFFEFFLLNEMEVKWTAV